MNGASDLPAWTPAPRELADLELLLNGAFSPLTGFTLPSERGVDGVPITLVVPEEHVPEGDRLVLSDPEGVPLAVLTITARRPYESGVALAGPVEQVSEPAHGPFRSLYRSPDKVRAELPDGPVLAVATRSPLHRPALDSIGAAVRSLGARAVLVLALGVGDVTLIRALLAARPDLPDGTQIIPVPLAARPIESELNVRLRAQVAAAYGATHLLSPERAAETAIPVIEPAGWTTPGLDALLDQGTPIPERMTPAAVASVLSAAHPPRRRRGFTVFFTGLSGSGKSTVARGLGDILLERGRKITYLDGDVVRRMLSAGLTFSREDRDLNIRRIGYVAAEVSRHGGVAICAPIAPYAATRAAVREMVRDAGGDFVLVYISTPLEECERRDRKGLYARARAGEIPSFTGISDPYEAPDDADLVLDTSQMSVEAAVSAVADLLTARDYVPPRAGDTAQI